MNKIFREKQFKSAIKKLTESEDFNIFINSKEFSKTVSLLGNGFETNGGSVREIGTIAVCLDDCIVSISTILNFARPRPERTFATGGEEITDGNNVDF